MLFTFMFSRPVKQAFICFPRNLFKLWQSESIIVSFLSSSHLESSLDHAQRWCRGRRKRDLQEMKCLLPLNEAKLSHFMHCPPRSTSPCNNRTERPSLTLRQSELWPFSELVFIHPIQTDTQAVAPGAICSKAWSTFLALLCLLLLTSALSPACSGCHCHSAVPFTRHWFVLHLHQQLTGALPH